MMSIDDEDSERKTQAEVLINAYSRELQRRRLEARAQGLLISGNGLWIVSSRLTSPELALSDDEEQYDSDSDESFHYPGAEPIQEAPSIRSPDYFSRQNCPRGLADLTPHLQYLKHLNSVFLLTKYHRK